MLKDRDTGKTTVGGQGERRHKEGTRAEGRYKGTCRITIKGCEPVWPSGKALGW